MPLYNEQRTVDTKDITRFERAHRIEIHNPLDGVPRLVMRTSWVERDNETGEEVQKEAYRNLYDVYDPSAVFDVISPIDGTVMGQSDYATLMSTMYGLFWKLAAEEDANG